METRVNRSLNQNLAVLHYYVGLYKYRKLQRRTCNIGDSSDLTHKVAIVVGGAGGVGRAQALGLAEAGADVIVASRQLENLEPVAKEIQARGRLTGRH